MTPATGMHHDALLYSDEAQFAREVGEFVRAGVRAGERTVVVEPPRQLELLRSELGEDAAQVEFLDMRAVGTNPARIIAVWNRLLEESVERGVRLRGVGEPAFVGRSADEFVECRVHEHLLNTAFAVGPEWNLLCPYDRANLPAAVVEGAAGTHPCVIHTHGHQTSEHYSEDIERVFGGTLAEPPNGAVHFRFSTADIASVRALTQEFAEAVGLADLSAADLVLVASELATNSVRHGGGRGVLSIWTDETQVFVEAVDAGVVREPLVGRLRPPAHHPGGRGLFLVNQICDLVQIRSGPQGTQVRASVRPAELDTAAA